MRYLARALSRRRGLSGSALDERNRRDPTRPWAATAQSIEYENRSRHAYYHIVVPLLHPAMSRPQCSRDRSVSHVSWYSSRIGKTSRTSGSPCWASNRVWSLSKCNRSNSSSSPIADSPIPRAIVVLVVVPYVPPCPVCYYKFLFFLNRFAFGFRHILASIRRTAWKLPSEPCAWPHARKMWTDPPRPSGRVPGGLAPTNVHVRPSTRARSLLLGRRGRRTENVVVSRKPERNGPVLPKLKMELTAVCLWSLGLISTWIESSASFPIGGDDNMHLL